MPPKNRIEVLEQLRTESLAGDVVVSERESLATLQWHSAVYASGIYEKQRAHRCCENTMAIGLSSGDCPYGSVVDPRALQRDSVLFVVGEFLANEMRARDVFEGTVILGHISQVDDRFELVKEAVPMPTFA